MTLPFYPVLFQTTSWPPDWFDPSLQMHVPLVDVHKVFIFLWLIVYLVDRCLRR